MKYRILIIEDSKTFNNMLKRALKSISSEIVQAFSFMEAEEYVENEDFDFIFLDLILPDGEGEDLIDMLPRRLRNKTIVLSGDDDIQKRAHLFELGILDYFSKLTPMNLILHDIKKLIFSLEENKKINVLIIDDSSFMRKKMKNILSARRYNILLAESAKEGFDILYENDIHLILLDIELGEMSGTEFLEDIKQNKEYLHIPVIAISGNDSPHIVARLLKHGAGDFIKKPFIVEQLILKCELHIQNYKNVLLLEQTTEELKRAQEAKSRFLANMSHEIRTPLNAIMGFIKLLKEKDLDEESQKYLDVVDSSSKTLVSVLNDILDFSKIESGKLTIEMIDFNPKKEFLSVIELFRLKAIEKNIHIEEKLENLPHFIRTDVTRLKQVLMNLLSNAIKFTPENKNIYVTIRCENKNLFISVKDEGIGLSNEHIDKIFHPFTQADDSTTRKYGGTGLGLAISSEIILLLGGELKVKSKLTQGSEFYLKIPIKISSKDDLINKPIIKKALKAKVLIVEDNKANQMFLGVILKKLKLDYNIANNGEEAIDMYKNEKFDIILMDENMPIMNGIKATQIIREIEKNSNTHIPIVAVTANALSGDKQRFVEAGFDDYLPKPVDIELLKQILAKYSKEDE